MTWAVNRPVTIILFYDSDPSSHGEHGFGRVAGGGGFHAETDPGLQSLGFNEFVVRTDKSN